MKKEKEISKEKLLDAHESLNDFVRAYFFTMKPRLQNAERITIALLSQKNPNPLLCEILIPYVQFATSEICLTLYDSIEVLKQISDFEYLPDSDIDHLMRFRHNIIAHRAKNWGSSVHTATRKRLGDESAGWIIQKAHGAVKDFVKELKNRKIPLKSRIEERAIQTIKTLEISLLFNSVPITQVSVSIPSQEEWAEFFDDSQDLERAIK